MLLESEPPCPADRGAQRRAQPWSEASRQRFPVVAGLIAREERGEKPGPGDLAERPAGAVTAGDPDRYVPARIDL